MGKEKLLTTEEAAELLGVSEEQIVTLVDTGDLMAYHLAGKFLRFRREHVDSLLKRQASQRASASSGAAGAPSKTPPQPTAERRTIAPATVVERISDLLYFYGFYMISAVCAVVLIVAIWVLG